MKKYILFIIFVFIQLEASENKSTSKEPIYQKFESSPPSIEKEEKSIDKVLEVLLEIGKNSKESYDERKREEHLK